MITFSEDQVQAFGKARFGVYLTELAARQKERHPDVYRAEDIAALSRTLAPEIRIARAVGMVTRRQMGQWADLVAVLGAGFQTRPWVARILDASHPPDRTLDLIAREAIFARSGR